MSQRHKTTNFRLRSKLKKVRDYFEQKENFVDFDAIDPDDPPTINQVLNASKKQLTVWREELFEDKTKPLELVRRELIRAIKNAD